MLKDLKMAICQMNVVPGRPDINSAHIVAEIKKAIERKIEIAVFSELCTCGYLIGDRFKSESFVKDVVGYHKMIRDATSGGITAVFGTVIPDWNKVGENGSFRLYNAAVVYSNGNYVGHAVKTLMPNYRMFDDDRHFYSSRKLAEELGIPIEELLKPIDVITNIGRTIRLGVTLCEDIWHEDYPVSPAGILTNRGAELIMNLSASPWTWQKNFKRQEIVRELAKGTGIPLVYVNNVGVQNSGKNMVVFDGCSTVYNTRGQAIFEAPSHASGTFDFVYDDDSLTIPEHPKEDDKEFFLAVSSCLENFFRGVPQERRKVVIGQSGGIDSGVTTALYRHVLGKDSVVCINMPMPGSNPILQEAARQTAENLGVKYEVIPINDLVQLEAKKFGVEIGSLAYENLQSRTRMNVLATRAQQLGGFFTANFNKVEQAFGYGTLGGDMEGCLAVLGDMIKREVYQLADYMNREVYKSQVIPRASFEEAPTADLKIGQKDPFDYGNLTRCGYHDEMVRAFTDFKKDPEWLIEMYIDGKLEQELKLEEGTLRRLFPTSLDFVKDLEKHWNLFFDSYYKRVQAPPVLIVSRSSFGADFRESMISAHLTERYKKLREELLSDTKNRVLLYGGSFNPPSLHHCQIAMNLSLRFGNVVVIPCGQRADKVSSGMISLLDKKELSLRAFSGIYGIELDTSDLDNEVYTPTYVLDLKYKEKFPDKEIWHVIGSDLIVSGSEGGSEIQTLWHNGKEVWENLNFLVVVRPGSNFKLKDLPPHSMVIRIDSLIGSSTMVRERIAAGLSVEDILLPDVWQYIKQNGLYGSKVNGGKNADPNVAPNI